MHTSNKKRCYCEDATTPSTSMSNSLDSKALAFMGTSWTQFKTFFLG